MVNIRRRGGFSERQGIKVENTEIQLKDLDLRTRIHIYNLMSEYYASMYQGLSWSNDNIQNFFRYISSDVFCEKIDSRELIDDNRFFEKINDVIINNSYDDVLTLIEAICEYWENELNDAYSYTTSYSFSMLHEVDNIFEKFNELFEREYVGYRFINGLISPISDDFELKTVKETLESEYSVIKMHIAKAHKLLADREHPDYENSIKESISSVEAMCQIITGITGKDATLGNMLKNLEKKGVVIHNALKSAFSILYGYTSDANGIRHAGDIGGKESTFEEAKFMLISCCAFINYLKGIMAD